MSIHVILAWNCRGASFLIALRHLKLLCQSNNPDILILEETWCPSCSINKLCRSLNFTHNFVAKAMGFSGDLWIMWNDSKIEFEEVSIDAQIINVLVRFGNQKPWLLPAIYASSNATNREWLWLYLKDLGKVVDYPWMLIGDFNQILNETEKKGGKRFGT